eukprot:scaffold878_cov271-Pinguiococcus_pyrenoidosus.AAC.2
MSDALDIIGCCREQTLGFSSRSSNGRLRLAKFRPSASKSSLSSLFTSSTLRDTATHLRTFLLSNVWKPGFVRNWFGKSREGSQIPKRRDTYSNDVRSCSQLDLATAHRRQTHKSSHLPSSAA